MSGFAHLLRPLFIKTQSEGENMVKKYQICSKCIMDTSDPDIEFDENGVCNHCKQYNKYVKNELHHDDTSLEAIISQIKRQSAGKRYDCIIGVSGGVDSTYVAYQVKKLGLRPLAVHLDNGWNSELAVGNIEKVLRKLEIDLFTHVIDYEEFKDMQIAFLKSSTPDSEIPTDHAILAFLYEMALKENIPYIITGQNIVTEGYGVPSWSQGHGDWRYIRSIYKTFGNSKKIKSYPHYNMYKFIYYTLIKKIKIIKLLNFIPYVKKEAIKILEDEFNYRPYAVKHGESIYTHFFQSYILPSKFGFDKRRIHFSALIASGQMTRDEALEEIKKELYSREELKIDKEYFIKKLDITEMEFEKIMSMPPKTFWDYPSYKNSPIFKSRFIKVLYYSLR